MILCSIETHLEPAARLGFEVLSGWDQNLSWMLVIPGITWLISQNDGKPVGQTASRYLWRAVRGSCLKQAQNLIHPNQKSYIDFWLGESGILGWASQILDESAVEASSADWSRLAGPEVAGSESFEVLQSSLDRHWSRW